LSSLFMMITFWNVLAAYAIGSRSTVAPSTALKQEHEQSKPHNQQLLVPQHVGVLFQLRS
jgi:hypothetical protein